MIRFIVADEKGETRAQLLDTEALRSIKSGRWDPSELSSALSAVCRAHPDRHVLAVGIKDTQRKLAKISGPVSVRRASATEGRLPKKLAMGSSPKR